MLASLISWFGTELFKGIIFTIGLAILIPFSALILIYVVASLDDHPVFGKFLSKKTVASKKPSSGLAKDEFGSDKPNVFAPSKEWRAANYQSRAIVSGGSEVQVQLRNQVDRMPVEDRYLFQEWSSELRNDLPDTHRYRSMRLKQTPVGNDFFETEEILQKLLPDDWSSERDWVLCPPVGPRPRASWGSPTWRQNHDQAALYVIKFNVKSTNGDTHTIFKAGITSRPIVGPGGRYSKKFGPKVIYENRLPPAQAWACEQKLLQVMHMTLFDISFEEEAEHKGKLIDGVDVLPKAKSNATIFGKDLEDWMKMLMK